MSRVAFVAPADVFPCRPGQAYSSNRMVPVQPSPAELAGASGLPCGSSLCPSSSLLRRLELRLEEGGDASLASGRLHWKPRLIGVALAAVASTKARRVKRRVKPGDVSPMRFVPSSIVRPPYLGPDAPRHPSEGPVKHEFESKVEIKDERQIAGMREACALAREALELAGKMVKPGITTEEIDIAVFDFCVARGAYPSPLCYMGYPKSVCTSVNDIIAHGIPDNRKLKDGDVLNIDVTVYLNGFHGDTSSMFVAGRPSRSALNLCKAAQAAMDAGIEVCGPGVDFREVGKAISAVVAANNCHCYPLFAGHGIGSFFHGAPEVVPVRNDDDRGVMKPGMTFTIEPILAENNDDGQFNMWSDSWTLQTTSGNWTAQFEHTVLITETGVDILTGPSIDYRAMAVEQLKELESSSDAAAERSQSSEDAASGKKRVVKPRRSAKGGFGK
eukprot:TRINITY_DN38252_c0_g1_i1.p1 TRINITY_DN38252_c0_g1~~TRINITY_DN38252_c0_g1_i1.p1  ORF type:complete len:444 (-),score=102.55 TRINITY_DN38252_c0_g1_i1:103-1434(-)